jgi:nucleoid-associated protein YgaU
VKNRYIIAGALIALALTPAFAAEGDVPIPANIRNNRYFVESVRLTNLAQMTFEEGDYDAAEGYATEAVRYAELSDEYVKLQLKIKEVNDTVSAAKRRLDWAASAEVNARQRYPTDFNTAQTAYNEAVGYRSVEEWDNAIAAAMRVISALAFVTEAPPADPVPAPSGLPTQYIVQPWSVSKDCFWNIAGRDWAYNDPTQWRRLYNANRSKMPEPDNPDLIHPGMVLDIPR